MASPLKHITVGELELTRADADELIGMFNMQGWQVLVRILENHKRETADALLGKARQHSLQDLGVAMGSYGTSDVLLDLPEQTSQEYEKFIESDKQA